MTKTILALSAMMIVAASCGNNSQSTSATSSDSANKTTSAPAAPANPDAQKGLALVAKSDCFTCHKINEKVVGPAYADVAAKYPATEANIDTLANKVIRGGSGNWGNVAMTPHPQLSLDDAKLMVKYVLSLKQ